MCSYKPIIFIKYYTLKCFQLFAFFDSYRNWHLIPFTITHLISLHKHQRVKIKILFISIADVASNFHYPFLETGLFSSNYFLWKLYYIYCDVCMVWFYWSPLLVSYKLIVVMVRDIEIFEFYSSILIATNYAVLIQWSILEIVLNSYFINFRIIWVKL
jgi:hypothetical protein